MNDARESPSIKIIQKLKKHKNLVDYNDQKIPQFKIGNQMMKSASIKYVKRYDCVLIITNHKSLKKNFILKNAKKIFDTRGVFARSNDKKIIKL